MGQFCCSTCRNTIFLLVILFASCLSQDVRGNEGTCSRPAAVANANLRSKYRNTEEFTEGSEVEYDCNIGYSITGRSRNRKCLKSGNWSPVEFECELIRCTYLPHPDNGRRTDANNGAGETTRFSCNPGYTLKGPSQLICRTDGEWSPRYTPKCEPILCPELLAPRNGDIFQDTSDGVRNNYESIVQYTCNYGYTINGTTSRTINRRCEADGTWDGYNYFCDTLKCEHIEFYGGTLNYFGSTHRAEGTYVYYSCYEGYTMFPPGVDYSECMRTSLRWKPDPPKCHGKCRLQDYQPIDNSLVRRQKDGDRKNVELADSVDIIHGEKIIYSCKHSRSYELCVRPNDQVLCTDDTLSDNFDTTCTNGSFDKVNKHTHISCQERRCSITVRANTCFWTNDEKCIKENFKIQSQSSVNITCNSGYEHYDNSHKRYTDSSTMKCERGNLLPNLSCEPKRCDMSDIPTNRFTIRTPDTSHIKHNDKIVYRCINDQYELYVNSTYSFSGSFTSTCKFGDFDVLKQNFPLCIERRCDITYHVFANACFSTSDDHGAKCKPENSKIASRSSVNIKCNDGYELYDTKQAKYLDVESSEMKCEKGHYLKDLSCKQKRCVLTDLPMNEFTVRAPRGSHLEHGQSINYTCKNPDEYELYVQKSDKYPSSFSARCSLGSIIASPLEFPLCVEKRCMKMFKEEEIVLHDNNSIKRPTGFTMMYKHGTELGITCASGYTMKTKSQNSETMTTACVLGVWRPLLTCIPKPCAVPVVSNAVLKSKSSDFYTHKEEVQFECEKWHHFQQKYIKGQKDLQTISNLSSTCEFGNWSKQIPERCYPDGCRFIIMNGSRYFTNENNANNELHEADLIRHNTSISTKCISGYDIMKADGSPADDLNPQVTCNHGNWTNIHVCKKRCSAINDSRVMNISDDGIALDYRHGEKVKINCMDDKEIKCVDGTWIPFDVNKCPTKKDIISEEDLDYPAFAEKDEKINTSSNNENVVDETTQNVLETSEPLKELPENINTTSNYENVVNETTQNVLETSETLKDCEIPNNPSYEYITDKDDEKKQQALGSFVTHGTVLIVKCSTVQYGNYFDEDDHTTVQCINGRLGTANISCLDETSPEEKSVTCNLKNGQVQPRSNYQTFGFEVSCNEGYKLNLIHPDKPYCKCGNTSDLVCDYGGQIPKCLPENCIIPEKNDSGLTIYVHTNGSDVGLSSGMEVKHRDLVYFKCTISETEPENTRLECVKGKWLQVGTNKEWLKLNSIPFPLCRKAICLPLCQNGGKCIRDDTCACQPQSTGRRCETVECDQVCHRNGGTCIAPGKCGQCPDGKSGNNCQDYGCHPPVFAPKILVPKEVYNTGEIIKSDQFVCPKYYVLMPRNGMTCLTGGWTETVKCIPEIKYAIQIKTGPDRFAGTNDKVYVNLHGEKYSTGPLNVHGSYNKNALDENNIWSVDVTPIKKITLSKDTSWTYIGDWQVTYVSIFVEKDDHHYVFDVNNIWIFDQAGAEIELSQIKYLIQIKTGSNTYTGPDTNLYVILHGDKYSSQKLYVGRSHYGNGVYEDTIMAVDISPIRNITIGRDSVGHRNDLQVDFVSIFVDFDNGRTTADDQFYNFDANPDLWIDGSADRTITLSDQPEICVHKFKPRTDVFPFRQDMPLGVVIGNDLRMSERACKQKCILHKTKKCVGVHYESQNRNCRVYEKAETRYFLNYRSNYFERYCS